MGRKGYKTKQRDKLKRFTKFKEKQRLNHIVAKNTNAETLTVEKTTNETTPFLESNIIDKPLMYADISRSTSQNPLRLQESCQEFQYQSISKDVNNAEVCESQDLERDYATTVMPSSYRLWITMCFIYLGIFLIALNNTFMFTFLPHITSEFGALSKISWIGIAYFFAEAIFLLLYDKFSLALDKKILLISSNLIFGCGCLVCGLSQNIWCLVIGRILSGVGSSGIISVFGLTIDDIVSLQSRKLFQYLANLLFGLGILCGGTFGCLFSKTDNSWKFIFLIQPPAIIVTSLLMFLLLNFHYKTGATKKALLKSKLQNFDWYGASSLIIFLILFTFVSLLSSEKLFQNNKIIYSSVIITIISFVILVYVELNISKDALLPVNLLRNTSILGSSLANCFCMMGMASINFYLPIYFSSVLEMASFEIGKRTIPIFFTTLVVPPIIIYFMKLTNYSKLLIFSSFFMTLGLTQVNLINPTISTLRQYILFFLPYIGTISVSTTLLLAFRTMPSDTETTGTSLFSLSRSMGYIFGIGISDTIFRSSLIRLLNTSIMDYVGSEHTKKELSIIIMNALNSSEYIYKDAPYFARDKLFKSYHHACKNVFTFSIICGILSMISCSFVKERHFRSLRDRFNFE